MNDPILQDIKDRLNIADVISSYIQIKKAGTNFKAICPFHHEKTPSLQISPQKQIWHCFGCGEGGDIFGFVMKYENLEFREALKILADKAGVQLPQYRPENQQQQGEKELLLRINNFASRYYHEILIADSRGTSALQYLERRGLARKTIEQWKIGFAPDDFHTLERALLAKKVNLAEAIKAGVIAKNDRGQMYPGTNSGARVYDRFRGRVTFPIFNYFGEVVGFSARILRDDGKSAKYVNSPETVIYNKSKILFGLNFAKEAIRKQDEVIIVEGQMDCVSSHQAGFKNVVASSGTALTELQLGQLGRLTKNLKFCFDADTAGQNASRRAGEMALKQGFKIKVVVLGASKDPDELIKKSPGLWQKAISEAVWFLDYYINLAESKFPAGSLEQKHYLSAEVVPFLGFINDPLEQDHYVHKIAAGFDISEKVIRQQIQPKALAVAETAAAERSGSPPGLLLEKEVLGGVLFYPEFQARYQDNILPEDFERPEISRLVKSILAGGPESVQAKQTALAKEAVFMLESQLDELGGSQPMLLRELVKALAMLKVNAAKKRQAMLQSEIKLAELAKNQEKIHELNRRFAEVSADRQKFESIIN